MTARYFRPWTSRVRSPSPALLSPATSWFYVNGTRTATTGQSEGTLKFSDALKLAADWVAYLLLNDGYTIAATSAFKVEK